MKDYITDGADDLGSAGKDDYYGYGRINVYGTANITPVIIYVDADAPGDDDGSSWANAYNELQNAFYDETLGDQIFVAAGTYYPDEGDSVTDNIRSETFQLINGVAVRGAFAGYGETNPYYRNTSTYTTTLSGDIDKDSVLDSDNSYHVVKGVDNATLEAFTVTKGYADGDYSGADDDGAGMYNNADSPTVASCTFSGNYAAFGGGMANYCSSDPTIVSCTFSNNIADPYVHAIDDSGGGGGMFNSFGSDPIITNCLFSGNSALAGGGVFDYEESSSTITNSIFILNKAEGSRVGYITGGGGMVAHVDTTSTLTNCLFIGNSSEGSGGGLYPKDNSDLTIINCTFSYNDADDYGGGIHHYSSNCDSTITNCILWGNSDTGGTDESAQIHGGTVDIDYSCVHGWTGGLGGTGNIGTDPDFDVDGFHLTSNSPCIDEGDPSGDYSGQVDIDGETREMGDEVDMGVDEYDPS